MECYRSRCYRTCIVPGCKDLYSKRHSFPRNDYDLYLKWKSQVCNPLLDTKTDEQIFKCYMVCDRHFSESDKVPGTRRGLRKSACPTEFLPQPLEIKDPLEISNPATEYLSNDLCGPELDTTTSNASISFKNNICLNFSKLLSSASQQATRDVEKENVVLQIAKELEPAPLSLIKEENNVESDEKFLCRTCLKTVETTGCVAMNRSFFYDKTPKEVIVFLVPEMNSKLKDDEVVCDDCVAVLKSTMEFIVKCLEVDSVFAKQVVDEKGDVLLETCKVETNEAEENVAADAEHDYCVKNEEEKPETEIDDETVPVDYGEVPVVFEALPEYYGEELELNDAETTLPTEKTPDFTCLTCLECFAAKEEYDAHLEFHPPYACDVCGKAYKRKESLRVHKFTHNDRNSFICEVCGKGFKDSSAIRAHLKNHASDRSYKCEKCPKVFKTRRVLEIHVKYVHDKRFETQCTVCGKMIRNLSALQSHMKVVHCKEKPFECNVCQKRFGRSDYLQNHKLRHAGEGRSNVKSQSDGRIRRRRTRMRFKTQNPGEPLPCKFCGQWYKGVVRLKRHLELHLKRFPCQFCPLTFPRNALCKRHEETHQGGAVSFIRCNVCWKKFKTKEALDKHVPLHNNPQHFCDLCGKTFNRKFLLSQHKLTEHSDLPNMEQIDTIIYDSLLEVGGLST